MRASFSFNDALAAPFALLRRRPLCVFVWGLIMTVLVAAIYSLIIPAMASTIGSTSREGAVDAYMLESVRLQAAVNGLNVLMNLVMLTIWTAAGRATLSHRGDRFLFLRLGMDEVRVAVVIVAVFFGWYVGLLVLILLGVGIGAALWGYSPATAVGVLIVYGLLVFAASVWGWLRVSLMAPASLILKRFAFAEGWAITRGRMWKLFGLNLVIWLIYLLSVILMYAVVGGVLVAGFFGQGLEWPRDIQTFADVEPLIRPMILPAALTALPCSLGFGWVMVLYAAPSVRAARQLLDGSPATAARPIVEDAPPADTLQPL